MKSRFRARCYSPLIIDNAIVKAHNISCSDLKKKRRKDIAKNNSRPVFVTKYSSSATEIKTIIKSNWELIHIDPILKDVS